MYRDPINRIRYSDIVCYNFTWDYEGILILLFVILDTTERSHGVQMHGSKDSSRGNSQLSLCQVKPG